MLERFTIYTDHLQFYVEDVEATPDYASIWFPDPKIEHLATAPGLISVGTARWADTTIEVEVLEHPPSPAPEAWDRIVECSLDVPSGQIRIYSPLDDANTARTMSLAPGTYRVLVQYGGIDEVDEYTQEGDDHYRLTLWPGTPTEPRLVK